MLMIKLGLAIFFLTVAIGFIPSSAETWAQYHLIISAGLGLGIGIGLALMIIGTVIKIT